MLMMEEKHVEKRGMVKMTCKGTVWQCAYRKGKMWLSVVGAILSGVFAFDLLISSFVKEWLLVNKLFINLIYSVLWRAKPVMWRRPPWMIIYIYIYITFPNKKDFDGEDIETNYPRDTIVIIHFFPPDQAVCLGL